MNKTIRIFCKNNGVYQDFEPGVSLLEIYEAMDIKLDSKLACARVNNKSETLTYTCYNPKDVEFIGIDDPSGMRAYVRTLCFIMAKAVRELYPDGRLVIEHPLSKGYYCDLQIGRKVTDQDVEQIEQKMQEIINAGLPVKTHIDQIHRVIEIFKEQNMPDKVKLLGTLHEVYFKYNSIDDYMDNYYGALLPYTNWIHAFGIMRYNGGLLLRVPNPEKPDELQSYVQQDMMMGVFHDLLSYQDEMDLSNVGDLNNAIRRGEISTVVKVAEALQERRISIIADEIAERYQKGVRVVLISGPSSSGKTTFCKRLQVQLLVNKLRPISISLDDYYVNRVDTPKLPNGEYDYESLYAIDLAQFNEDLKKLINGEEVALPTYDFNRGERVYRGNKIQLTENSVLVMEGIHAMNPDLLPLISPQSTYKVYVSALTSISLDDHNWVSTADNRLIRRMVRDYQFRGYSAIDTISRWPLVREGEDKWIFPYQENADAMFNSAMLYELASLRRIAEPILQEVPRTVAEYAEAYRLLKFLRFFNYVDANELPNTSLLREFVGGSLFKY